MSLAQELKKQSGSCQIVYVGHKGDRFDNLAQVSSFDFTAFINGGKFRRYHGESVLSQLLDVKTLILNTRDLFRVIKATAVAWRILVKFRPDVVFSKGGFVAVPVGIAARIRGIPIVTHDSDTVPGLANRIIGRWAKVNATGMPIELYPYPKQKMRYTGIPVSRSLLGSPAAAKKALGLPPKAVVLLVAGGGLGSKTINSLVAGIAPTILGGYPKLHILHIAGQKNEAELKQLYHSVLDPAQRFRLSVVGFTRDFDKYVLAADLIVGRAGASSIAEYALAAKACIIIPSPFLAGGHQLKNAELLKAKNAAAVLSNDVDGDEFTAVLNELLGSVERRQQLAKRLKTLARPDAAVELARLILEVAKRA